MLIRLKESVMNLKPYFVSKQDYELKLNANESNDYLLNNDKYLKDFNLNEYPDTNSDILRSKLGEYYGCTKNQIILGNGSSDLINQIINNYCNDRDTILSFEPSFSMYKVYAALSNTVLVPVNFDTNSNKKFEFSIESFIKKAIETKPKIAIFCNPNNPTGTTFTTKEVIKLADEFEKNKNLKDTILLIDEAYIEFSKEESFVKYVKNYSNIIVTRTLSKVCGLAGIRVGAMVSSEELIYQFMRVKIPYNINTLSQMAGLKALENIPKIENHIDKIIESREFLRVEFKNLNIKVLDGKANFLLINPNIINFGEKMLEKKVLISTQSGEIEGFYRVSIPYIKEGKKLLKLIKEVIDENC